MDLILAHLHSKISYSTSARSGSLTCKATAAGSAHRLALRPAKQYADDSVRSAQAIGHWVTRPVQQGWVLRSPAHQSSPPPWGPAATSPAASAVSTTFTGPVDVAAVPAAPDGGHPSSCPASSSHPLIPPTPASIIPRLRDSDSSNGDIDADSSSGASGTIGVQLDEAPSPFGSDSFSWARAGQTVSLQPSTSQPASQPVRLLRPNVRGRRQPATNGDATTATTDTTTTGGGGGSSSAEPQQQETGDNCSEAAVTAAATSGPQRPRTPPGDVAAVTRQAGRNLLQTAVAAAAARPLPEALQGGPDGSPPSAVQVQRQIRRLRRSGRLAAALDLSYMGMSCHPRGIPFWASAACLETRIGRPAAAVEVAEEALRRWPNNPALLVALGRARGAAGDLPGAEAALRAALRREPNNAVVHHVWAMCAAACGHLPAARQHFRTASQLDPDMPHTYTAWGRLEAAVGDEAAARQLFEEGHKADPTHVPLLHAWAVFEGQHDKQSAARRLLTQALELEPHHVPSWMAMGQLEWRTGNPQAAREVFEAALAAVGPSAPLLCCLAELELRVKNVRRAREIFEHLRARGIRHLPALLSAAQMEHRAGNAARARSLYDQALAAAAAGVVRDSEGMGLRPRRRPPPPSPPPPPPPPADQDTASGGMMSAVGSDEPAQPQPQAQAQQQGQIVGAATGAASEPQKAAAGAVETPVGTGNHQPPEQPSSPPPPPQQQQQQRQAGALGAAAGPVDEEVLGDTNLQELLSYMGASMASMTSAGQGQQQQQPTGAGGNAAVRWPPALMHARAVMLLRAGHAAAAAERWLLAVEAVEPNNGYLCHTRGLMCQGEGEMAAAEAWFRSGTTCRTSCEGALLCYEGLAELLAFKGQKEEARAVWRGGAAAVHPPTSRFLRQAALFEKKVRNHAVAAPLFKDAVRRDPQDYRSWLQWAMFERRNRNWDRAERCFQRGTAVAPGYPYLWHAYASMLVELRRIRDARATLQIATQHCPRCAPLWLEWALMEAAAGEAEAARRLFKRGSEVPPAFQHEPLYQAWAAFEEAQGNPELATQLRQRAAELVGPAASPAAGGKGARRGGGGGGNGKAKATAGEKAAADEATVAAATPDGAPSEKRPRQQQQRRPRKVLPSGLVDPEKPPVDDSGSGDSEGGKEVESVRIDEETAAEATIVVAPKAAPSEQLTERPKRRRRAKPEGAPSEQALEQRTVAGPKRRGRRKPEAAQSEQQPQRRGRRRLKAETAAEVVVAVPAMGQEVGSGAGGGSEGGDVADVAVAAPADLHPGGEQ